MEATGLINNFLESISSTFIAYQLAAESKEQQVFTTSLSSVLSILKSVSNSKNVNIIITVEFLALRQELEFYANSSEETNSINMALKQLEEAKKALFIVHDFKIYTHVAQAFSSKRKESGLPLDAFREFIKSHTTRLTNRLSAPLLVSEKNLLRQRKENLKVVKEIYVELQRNALGMDTTKKKEISL